MAITLLGPKDKAFRDQLLAALGGGKSRDATAQRGEAVKAGGDDEQDDDENEGGADEPSGGENKVKDGHSDRVNDIYNSYVLTVLS